MLRVVLYVQHKRMYKMTHRCGYNPDNKEVVGSAAGTSSYANHNIHACMHTCT